MKPTDKKILTAEQLPSICNYYARQHQGLYAIETTNIFLVKRIQGFGVPHKKTSNYIYSPTTHGIIVVTDAPNHTLDDWIDYMGEDIISHWQNPKKPFKIKSTYWREPGDRRKRGRKKGTSIQPMNDLERRQIIKAIEVNMKTKEFSQIALAGRLGISASYLCQLKKRHLSNG